MAAGPPLWDLLSLLLHGLSVASELWRTETLSALLGPRCAAVPGMSSAVQRRQQQILSLFLHDQPSKEQDNLLFALLLVHLAAF